MLIVKARRILLIENETAIRELTQLCLETVASWEVLTADMGSEMIVKAETEQVDAILVDISAITNLMDWQTILQQLQENPVTKHIPIILLTYIEQYKDVPQLIKLGVTAAIAKPFDLLTLASQVAAVLNWNS